MSELKFTTISNARKQTKLSYLGGVNISQKIIKSQKVNSFMTYCLYLAPASTSGFNVCTNSTPECRKGCLATSGRAAVELWSNINKIHNCRINKTKLFHEQPSFFMDWLIAEIKSFQNKANKLGYGFAVRLNGTSDINWANVKHNGLNIFETLSDIQFYDYTKMPSKFYGIADNYHLTLSYTGHNWEVCKFILSMGFNVAMIFNVPNNKPLPKSYNGYDVVNGDLTDLRIKDAKGIIVGLHWKKIADKAVNEEIRNSVFVIQPNDVNVMF